jgi:3-deoxy-manno-octulosonate cytidylyltransferase (CMP-KDO synthetase)
MINLLGIIPSRFGSSRFPGKPLIDLNGKSMIERVYEQAKKSKVFSEIIIATDDARIADHAVSFGALVILTSPDHPSGTDRCMEALQKYSGRIRPDFVINIQGDEPLLDPAQLEILAGMLNQDTELASLMSPIHNEEIIVDPNTVKVVINNKKEALYFSRSPIPYLRDQSNTEKTKIHPFYKHVGLYAYRVDILQKICKLKPSGLELAESLEQLRWLENGFKIYMGITEKESMSVDTPEDAEKVRQILSNQQIPKLNK